jgi:hypothetical protein
MLSDSLQVGYPGLRFSVTEDEQQMLKVPTSGTNIATSHSSRANAVIRMPPMAH